MESAVGTYILKPDLPMVNHRRFTRQWLQSYPLTLLVFYKQSCDTCTFIIPYLNRFYLKSGGSNCMVLISQDSFPETDAFVQKLKIEMPVAVDHPDYPLSRLLNFNGVPANYLVDSSGKVIAAGEGFLREEMVGFIQQLQKENRLKPADLFLPGEEIPLFKPG